MSEDYGTIEKQLSRIADALEQLVIKESDSELADNIMNADPQFNKEKLEITEEVLMDLKEVTVIAQTELSLLVTKKGYQKWVAFSLMANGNPKVPDGSYLEDITIREDKRAWFNEKKSWDKLVVKK